MNEFIIVMQNIGNTIQKEILRKLNNNEKLTYSEEEYIYYMKKFIDRKGKR